MDNETRVIILSIDDQDFSDFVTKVETYSLVTIKQFTEWEKMLGDIVVFLDKDPTTNLAGFYEKLEQAQNCKNNIVDILVEAIVFKAQWELYFHESEVYVRKARSELFPKLDVKASKNKELQMSAMYAIRPDIFECSYGCEKMLDWVKTMYVAFDAKLTLMESANLNINRQITVTELLTYKGLL